MERLILHIGTPKTGSTTLQMALDTNTDILREQNVYRLVAPGRTELTAYVQDDDPLHTKARKSCGFESHEDLDGFRENFEAELKTEMQGHPRNGTALISIESLGSMALRQSEVSRARDLLAPLFDSIEVVMYVRRQDLRATSMFSQALKGGQLTNDYFPAKPSRAYNYNHIYHLWRSAFPEAPIHVRVFERDRLYGGDIVQDFAEVAGISVSKFRIPEQRNVSFSAEGHYLVSRLLEFAAREAVPVTSTIQRYLNKVVVESFPGRPSQPGVESARAFYSLFREDNDALFEHLGMRGFSEDFSMYPEQDSSCRWSRQELTAALQKLMKRVSADRGSAVSGDCTSDDHDALMREILRECGNVVTRQ